MELQRERDDPPDFWLTLDGIRFAVEVTSIVTNQGYRANSLKLKQAIFDSAANLLRGRYILTLMDYPDIPRRNSKEWKQLVVKATSYIDNTRDTDTAPECMLLKNHEGSIAINKISGNCAAIGLAGPIEAKWEGEVEDELTQLMQTAVNKKRCRLLKKGVPNQGDRLILLLYDAYGLAESEDAQRALLKVKGYDWFHSVYWVESFTNKFNNLCPKQPGRSGIFLYSKDTTWWQIPIS